MTVLPGLTDPSRCPCCGAALTRPRCDACGADLSGPTAARLWQVSGQIGSLLVERDGLVATLRREAVAPSRTAPTVTGPAVPPVRPPLWMAPPPRPARTPLHRSVLHRLGVQGLLVGLGALLLSVAALTFLLLSWDRMGLALRAAVVATLTAAVLVAAGWLRPRLASTAEAVGALGVVLVLSDGWAVRRLGVWGADQVPGVGYSAGVAAVAAVLLGGWAWGTRVRAGSVAAAVLLPVAAVLAGLQGALSRDHPTALAAGLLLAASLGLARPVLPVGWPAERAILLVATWTALTVLLPVLVATAADDRPVPAAVLALGAALLATALCRTEPARRPAAGPLGLRVGWSFGAGGYLAVAGGLAGYRPGEWKPVLVPLGVVAALAAALLVLRLIRPRRTRVVARLHPAAAASGSVLVLLAGAVPAGLLVLERLLAAASGAFPAWRFEPGDPLADLLRSGLVEAGIPGGTAPWLAGSAGLLLAGLAGPAVLLRGRVPVAGVLPLGALAAGAALTALPLAGRMSVLGAVLLLALLAGLAVAPAWLGLRLPAERDEPVDLAHALLLVSALSGGLAVLLCWAARPLSVAGTVVGAAALLGARRLPPPGDRTIPALLSGLAAGSTLLAAGALPDTFGPGSADPWPARLFAAGLAGAALAALALTRPAVLRVVGRAGGRGAGRASTDADRWATAAPAGLAGAVAVVAGVALSLDLPEAIRTGQVGLVADPAVPHLVRLQLLLAGWLAVGVLVALLGRLATARLVAAAVVPPLATGLLWSLARAQTPDLAAALLPAVVVALSAGVLAALALGLGRTPAVGGRWRTVAGSALGCAVPALLLVWDLSVAWLVLLLLGSAAAAVAAVPGHQRLGWVAGVLLTGSTWARLTLSEVSLVEAYTLPPALALLGLAGLRLRRAGRGPGAGASSAPAAVDPGIRRVALTGAALALGPSLLACLDRPDLRPAVMIGLAATSVALTAVLAGRRPGRPWRAVLATAAVAAGGAGLLRGAAVALGVLPWAGPGAFAGPEVWALAAGAVLAAAALVAAPLAGRWPEPGAVTAAALLVAGSPTLLAVLAGQTAVLDPDLVGVGPRAAGVLVGAAAAALGSVWLTGPSGSAPAPVPVPALVPARLTRALAGPVRPVALGLLVAAATLGVWSGSGPAAELWTVSTGAVLVALGERRLAARPDLGSAAALGPGLAFALLPSLWLASHGGPALRVVLLAAGAAAVLLAGVALRWQAPTLAGGGVLAAHAVVQLAPRLVDAYQAMPRWVSLGLLGLLLLLVGARYEQRIRDLRTVRLRLTQLR